MRECKCKLVRILSCVGLDRRANDVRMHGYTKSQDAHDMLPSRNKARFDLLWSSPPTPRASPPPAPPPAPHLALPPPSLWVAALPSSSPRPCRPCSGQRGSTLSPPVPPPLFSPLTAVGAPAERCSGWGWRRRMFTRTGGSLVGRFFVGGGAS